MIHKYNNFITKFNNEIGFYQLKFESKSAIVIDLFDLDGEHNYVIGYWDFYDDLHPMFKN
jgi:hypothetical protein